MDISADPIAHPKLNHTSTRLILDERIGFRSPWPAVSSDPYMASPTDFPTMIPHAIGTAGGPCEIMGISVRYAGRGRRTDPLDEREA